MKQLTYISGTNIRGFDFQHELKPVTVFCGGNESGKTAALDAIRIALLGYLPRLGKQNEATMKLASQNRLELSVSLGIADGDCGFTNVRMWRRQPNGELKKSEQCQIKDIPEVLFDLRAWLGLTQKKRIEMIFERLGKTEVEVDELALISKLSATEVLPVEEGKASVADLLKFVNNSIKKRKMAKMSAPDWLSSLVKELDDEKKNWSNKQEIASSQIVTLRPATFPKSVQPEIDKISAEVKDICEKIATMYATRDANTRAGARRKQLETIRDQKVPTDAEIKQLELQVSQLKAKIGKFKSEVPELEKLQEQKRREYTALKIRLDAAMALTAKLEDQIVSIASLPHCPTCKTKKKGWQEEWKEKLTDELAISSKTEAELNEKIETITGHGQVLTSKLDSARREAARNDQEAKTMAGYQSRLENASRAAYDRNSAIAELAAMAQIAGSFDQAELEKLQKRANDISSFKDELLKKQEEFNRFEADKTKSEKLTKDLIAAQTRVEVFRKASLAVVEIQETILGHAFSSILVHARRFTDGILLGPLDYRDGELGMDTEKGWVSHETFSGRGQALAYVGLSIALAQSSPIRIVILDEAGIFDKGTKLAVVKRLLELTAEGFIDGAYLADPDPEDYVSIQNQNFALIKVDQ